MISIDVRPDIKDVTRMLTSLERKQVPFATALALTQTANDVKREEDKQIPKKLHNPTKFTSGAVGVTGAKKTQLVASVFIKDIQGEYLNYQIEGGTRRKRRKTGVPTRNKKLNIHGNIAGRKKGLVKGKKQFIDTIKGITGVWERTGNKKTKGVKLMVAFEDAVKYSKRFPFYKIAQGITKSKFNRNFNRALQRAIDTAI